MTVVDTSTDLRVSLIEDIPLRFNSHNKTNILYRVENHDACVRVSCAVAVASLSQATALCIKSATSMGK